jgi:hypothetical protein
VTVDHIDSDSQGQTTLPSLPVAITGMHRSGTSMVAKLLREAGLHLGAESDLMPPADENPEGFFEHLDFVRLNDEILNAAGAGWDCPPPPGVDWGAGIFNQLRDRARLLAEPLEATRPWGWKDPRTSLTLPFWRSALGPLRTIIVVRNPLEVVTSLHRRNGFSVALGLTLWQIYSERALADTSPDDRLVTHYDAYFFDPEKEIGRVLAFLGLEGDRDWAALRTAAIPDLRHYRKTLRDLQENGFPAEVVALYRRFCAEAAWVEEAVDDNSERRPQQFDGGASIARGLGSVDLVRVENEALRRNNDDFRAALANREARIQELEMALETHEAVRAELESRVKERESRVAERNVGINRRDLTIEALQRQLATNAAEHSQLREEVANLTARLAESERKGEISAIHERELRAMLTGLQAIQMGRDAEIMGTLGAVLSRHAPGAPAAIYHRRLLDQVQQFVDAHLPPGSRTLVASYGDSAMLLLGDRATEHFPQSASGVVANYTDVSAEEAVAQLEALRDDGAEFLVVPSPALPWLASHPDLERHLDQQCTPVARERGIGAIYGLVRQQAQRQIPA